MVSYHTKKRPRNERIFDVAIDAEWQNKSGYWDLSAQKQSWVQRPARRGDHSEQSYG